MSRLLPALRLLLPALILGCTDEPDGTAPAIANLSLTPTTLTAGQQTTMSGTLTFVDPEADVLDLGIEVELPDASHQMLPLTDVRGSAGTTEGTIQISIAVVPPAAGTYRFEVWLEDAMGHESNRLQASAQAVQP